jgi:hypothetical protein
MAKTAAKVRQIPAEFMGTKASYNVSTKNTLLQGICLELKLIGIADTAIQPSVGQCITGGSLSERQRAADKTTPRIARYFCRGGV